MRPNRTSANDNASKGFSAEEKAAARERVRELKAEAAKADGKTQLLAAIARMEEPDRGIARKIHGLITAAAPTLTPKTWYEIAYAKDGNVICYFQNPGEFKIRFRTLGFSDSSTTRRVGDALHLALDPQRPVIGLYLPTAGVRSFPRRWRNSWTLGTI